MTAATKKTRSTLVGGTEHTEASLAEMKTGDIAALVEALSPEAPQSKAEPLEATAEPRGSEKEGRDKTAKVPARSAKSEQRREANKQAKLYSIADRGAEAAESMTPQAALLVRSMLDASRPLRQLRNT